jgi:hypothetical protein
MEGTQSLRTTGTTSGLNREAIWKPETIHIYLGILVDSNPLKRWNVSS